MSRTANAGVLEAAWNPWMLDGGPGEYQMGKRPAAYLRQHVGLLPGGRVLDAPAGEGRNAVYLAEQGFEVDAVDISEPELRKARELAADRGVGISTRVVNLESADLGTDRYDAVTHFYYLERRFVPALRRALKPGGVVIFETYTVENMAIASARGPRKRPYLLEKGEARRLFGDFEILRYVERRTWHGAVASLVARKPMDSAVHRLGRAA